MNYHYNFGKHLEAEIEAEAGVEIEMIVVGVVAGTAVDYAGEAAFGNDATTFGCDSL